jgi:hypothetical protein
VLARFLLWRLLGVAAAVAGLLAVLWLLHGGLGTALRGAAAESAGGRRGAATTARLGRIGASAGGSRASAQGPPRPRPAGTVATPVRTRDRPPGTRRVAAILGALLVGLLLAVAVGLLGLRRHARRGRRYARLRVVPYRTDHTTVEGIVAMYEALHKRLQLRWWRRLLGGQPSFALEVHHRRTQTRAARVWLAVVCPVGSEGMIETALRSAYPNCRLTSARAAVSDAPPAVLRLKKRAGFIKRVKGLDRYELAREPPMNRLMTVLGACGEDAFVQLALTPAPAFLEAYAKRLYKHHEAHLSRERREHLLLLDRSLVEDSELRGGLDVQHRPLFFLDLRIAAPTREICEHIASELRAEGAENRLVERGAVVRQGRLGLYGGRVARGEGNPWPSLRKGVFASTELAALWHLPSVDYCAVPFARGALPLAPAPPAIMRPGAGAGTLRDALGPVCIHPELRRQNTAVPGAVEQGKSSYLAATVAQDLLRERCAVIVLDPKGDAAAAAISLVAPERTCTLLDFAHPTCGFNPLAVQAPADVIADYVVGALKHLFTDDNVIMQLHGARQSQARRVRPCIEGRGS